MPISPLCEPGQRSVHGNAPTVIHFVNCRQRAVKLFWLDYTGKRVEYETVEPGKHIEQKTYLTHPWVVVERGGREEEPVGIWQPLAYPATACIW